MASAEVVRALIFECLKLGSAPQLQELVAQVMRTGFQNRQLESDGTTYHPEHQLIWDLTQQQLWQLCAQGALVWGVQGNQNDKYPFFRLTEYGKKVVDGVRPQPYDPDGFLKHFDERTLNVDPVVRAYVEEAVLTFNARCYRATAVMLGAASEKLVLLLIEAFGRAIRDATKQSAFEKDQKSQNIYTKYNALKKRLDQMVEAKKLPYELKETVGGELPAGFELIRRTRNSAGHPEAGGNADADVVFMNLRLFAEYARRVKTMIDHFGTSHADW